MSNALATFEWNPALKQAYRLMNEGQDTVFLTGKAGSGKSSLLSYFRAHTSKRLVVLAPTGVAALTISGETVHSFFKFKPNITVDIARKKAMRIRKRETYERIDAIVIDEISMLRADLLDCADIFLRTVLDNRRPFGGKQMIFIGDAFQLPPVLRSDEAPYFYSTYNSPYFFSSRVFHDPTFAYEMVELTTVYRQSDPVFLDLLNAVRNNCLSPEQIARLNETVIGPSTPIDDDAILLCTTNRISDAHNSQKLQVLPGPPRVFTADIDGDFNPKLSPTQEILQLKVGARVMFLTNDSMGRWVNGSIGTIVDFMADEVVVHLPDKGAIAVSPFEWEMFRYTYNEKTKQVEPEALGSFTQYPLKLAWAVTIHKSQSQTFDKVVLDFGSGTFASGQAYVALSRCRSLEGIQMRRPFQAHYAKVDAKVVAFSKQRSDKAYSL